MDELIYSDDVLVSSHTNRPITDLNGGQRSKFWCNLCRVGLSRPVSALQHMKGRVHTSNVNKIKRSKPLIASVDKSKNSKLLSSKQTSKSTNKTKATTVLSEPALKKSKSLIASVDKSKESKLLSSKQTSKPTNKTKATTVLSEPALKKSKSSQPTSLLRKPGPQSNSKVYNHHVPALNPYAKKKQSQLQLPKIQPELPKIQPELPKVDPNLKCDQCNIIFDSLVQSLHHFKYTSHTVPTYSNNNISADEPVPMQTVNASSQSDEQVGKKVDIKCEDCDLSFKTTESARKHFEGKRHKRNMLAKEAVAEKDVLSWWQQSGSGRGAKIGAAGGSHWAARGRRKRPVRSQKANSNILPPDDLDIALHEVLGGRLLDSSHKMQMNSFHGNPADPAYAAFTNTNRLNRYEPDDEFQTSQYQSDYSVSKYGKSMASLKQFGRSEMMYPSNMNNGKSFQPSSGNNYTYENY